MIRIMIFDGAPTKAQRVIEAHGGLTNRALFERALSLHREDLSSHSTSPTARRYRRELGSTTLQAS